MSKMNRRYTFSAVAMLIATAVFIFITLTMLCIVMEETTNLDTVFQNDEVLCALKLSFCTAFIYGDCNTAWNSISLCTCMHRFQIEADIQCDD